MRLIFIILAAVGSILGIILSCTPLGNIALIPAVAGLVFGIVSLVVSEKTPQAYRMPKIWVAIAILAIVIVLVKPLLFEEVVATDEEFEQLDQQSEQEAIDELEELDIEIDN